MVVIPSYLVSTSPFPPFLAPDARRTVPKVDVNHQLLISETSHVPWLGREGVSNKVGELPKVAGPADSVGVVVIRSGNRIPPLRWLGRFEDLAAELD